MELIYTASKSSKFRKDWVVDESPICCLSPRNTIAFTSSHSLTDDANCADSVEALHHVYVCDMDKPWDIHLVTRSVENVVALQWNDSATKLIIATALGKIQIWSIKDYLINKWECINKATIEGEEIVSLGWLHTGVRVNFHAEKKDSVPYTERISRAQFSPSLCHFGGKATEGIVTITASGMVVIGLLTTGENMNLQTESLGSWLGRLKIADLTYESNGDIIIAASDGQIGSSIQCYKVTLKKEHASCSITCKPVASLYANCNQDNKLRDSNTARVTHIQFIHTQCGEVLIVGAGDVNTSHIEFWQRTDHQPGVHRFFQSAGSAGSSTPPQAGSRYSTHKWVHRSSVTHGSLPVSIAIPRFPVVYNMSDAMSGLFQYVAVSYRDGSVKLINRHTFQPISTTNLDTGICETDQGEKRTRTLPFMAHMQQTFTGCSLVGLDQFSCLYVMRAVNNTRDPMTMVLPVFLVSMLEYSMICGYDWWDVLASLRKGLVENVIQKLSDNFVKQPGPTQELLYARFLSMKASLCKVSNIGQQRAADCHCQIMLHSLATAFKSLLRPKTISATDSGPAEKLSSICSKSLELDLDKLLIALNPDKKEFYVESSTLQALQPLIQWVADLTLYLLSCLPMLQGHTSSFPGAVLVQDAGALSMLRELLIIIRTWGLTNISCLPHFTTTSPNFDCLHHLYRLLTKVWMIRNDKRSIDGDDAVIDECCLLPSQVMIPQVDQALFGDTNYHSSIFFQDHPQKYTFSQVAKHASRSAYQVVLSDGSMVPQQCRDVVRFVNLGVYPLQQMRECCRCGCLSLLEGPSRVSALLAWDLRWAKSCPCGGHWKVKNPSVDILV